MDVLQKIFAYFTGVRAGGHHFQGAGAGAMDVLGKTGAAGAEAKRESVRAARSGTETPDE
ncbi:MAG: hypothetical protein VB138_13400 [Burkholderia sp.]